MHLLIQVLPDYSNLIQYYTNYQKKFPTDSGLDLIVPIQYVIPPHTTVAIHLGICCTPVSDTTHGYYLYPRSSLSKTKLRLANSVGIIDASYRGEILAMVDNIGDHEEIVAVGSKLFQICAHDLSPFTFSLADELDMTERGMGGFGSTGIIANVAKL